MSTASTASAPRRAATMANTPVPLPISRPRNPVTSRSSNPEAIRQVVAWWPVPNDILGMMTTSASVAAGAWNGARIVSRPSTSTGVKLLSHSAFQFCGSMLRKVARPTP